MRSLYLVFIISVGALLWAAYAIARTIRRHERREQGLPQSPRLPSREGEPGVGTEISPGPLDDR